MHHRVLPNGHIDAENRPFCEEVSIGRRLTVSSPIPIMPTDRFLVVTAALDKEDILEGEFSGTDTVIESEKIIPTTRGSPLVL